MRGFRVAAGTLLLALPPVAYPGVAQAPVAPERPNAAATGSGGGGHPVRISAVGDLILGDTPVVPADPAGYLRPVRHAIRWRADVAFANLEGALTTVSDSKCGSAPGGGCYAFRNPPGFARAFARTGFTILNDANNHSHDFGAAGLRQTVRAIHRAGMRQTGLPGQVSVQPAVSVAVVGFAPYRNTADLLDLAAARRLIRAADREAGLVVVYMHAGAEGAGAQHVTGREEHYLGEDRGNPRRFAHLAVRAGADLVIASGPHVLRGVEFFHGRLIDYSLGNFANYHNFAGGGVLSDSAVLHVTLSHHGRFRRARLIPVHLAADGRAFPGGGSVAVVRRLSRQDFGARAARIGRSGRIRPPRR